MALHVFVRKDSGCVSVTQVITGLVAHSVRILQQGIRRKFDPKTENRCPFPITNFQPGVKGKAKVPIAVLF